MTWLKFTLWLAVFYTLYYGGLIAWELLQAQRKDPGDDVSELTFVEDAVPLRKVEEDERTPETADYAAVVSSGGVRLKDIFRLAQEEAIEYIRPVSF